MMKNFTKLMLTAILLVAGVGGVTTIKAETVKLYSAGFTETVSGNCSYDEETKKFTWSSQYVNAVTVIKFTAGLLPYISTVNLHVDDIKEGGEFRIIVKFGTDTQYWQTVSSTGDISLSVSDFQKWGTKITADEISTAFEIRLSGSDGEAHIGDWVQIDPTSIYLETSWEAPMQIASADDWAGFSKFISSGKTNLNAVMTADVDGGDIMVGTTASPYEGTFDGAGHTLTFNYDGSTSNGIAPFQCINNAIISNLTTAGSINAQNVFGGIVGTAGGESTLNYCTSSMNLTANHNGDSNNGRVGGLVGRCADNATPVGTSITFNNCIFNGSISSTQDSRCCGLVSWARSTTVKANNCLIAATSVTRGAENIAATGGTNPTVTPTNCYYTKKFGYSSQGTVATDAEIASGKLCYLLNESTVPSTSYFFGQGYLNSSRVEALPSVTSVASKKVYKAGNGQFYANSDGLLPDPALSGKLSWKMAMTYDPLYFNELPAASASSFNLYGSADAYLLTVSSAGATTLVLPYDIASLPDGVKAYDLSIDGTTVTATEVNSIKADKPVLINADAGEYIFTTGKSYDTNIDFTTHTSTTNGALTGVYNTSMPFSYVPKDAYVLQNGEEGLGFYKVANNNEIKITSFRAYMTAQNQGARLKIVYPGEITAVKKIAATKCKEGVVYNLNGQRITKATKGLYLMNGKKYVK